MTLDHVANFSNWIKGGDTFLLLLSSFIEFLGDLFIFTYSYSKLTQLDTIDLNLQEVN